MDLERSCTRTRSASGADTARRSPRSSILLTLPKRARRKQTPNQPPCPQASRKQIKHMAAPATNSSAKRACTAAVIRRDDWANLPAGPASLIAEQLLTDGVTGYLRFRQVCAPWRRCTEPPSSPHDSRFHPRRWIMLPEVFAACPDRRDFLNVSTGECIRVDLPELRDRLVLGPTSEGLLLLLCGKGTGDLHLLNPLTKQLTPLPNAAGTCLLSKLKKLQVCNAGLADTSTILLPFDDRRQVEMAVARLGGDEQWSYHSWPESDSIVSTTLLLSFSNRFYCVTGKGIKALDISAAAGQRPKLVVAAVEKDDDQGFHWAGDILVDNDGELIMVGPTPGKISLNYRAHRVDLDAGKMVPIDDLRGRAVFVCNHTGRSVSVRAAIFPSIRADTVYRCRRSSGGDDDEDEDGRPSVVACHVKKGWVRCKVRFDRGSIEDYLSRYVCRSKDIVLPAPPLRRSLCWPAAAVPRKRKANSKLFGDDWFN